MIFQYLLISLHALGFSGQNMATWEQVITEYIHIISTKLKIYRNSHVHRVLDFQYKDN